MACVPNRAVEESPGKAQRARKKKRVQALRAKAKKSRLDGLHKMSSQLVRQNRAVVADDVSSKNLAKKKTAKSI